MGNSGKLKHLCSLFLLINSSFSGSLALFIVIHSFIRFGRGQFAAACLLVTGSPEYLEGQFLRCDGHSATCFFILITSSCSLFHFFFLLV